MSKITKANEIKIPETVVGLIYGQPGVGKSSLALSMPNPLLIDTDNGIARVQAEHRCDTVQVESYQDVIDVIQEDLSEYDSIVIDTFGNLVKFMLKHFADQPGANLVTKGGTYNIKIWGLVKAEFGNLTFKLKSMKKNLLFVAHQNESKDGEQTYIRPKSQGSAIEDVIEMLDFMGYCEMLGKRRSISFSPCDRYYAKNSIKLDDYIQIPILEQNTPNNFMVDYIIKPSVERRKTEQLEHAKDDKAIALGKEEILLGLDNPNAVIAKFKEMDLSPYAKGILFKELCNSTELVFKDGRFE